MSKHKLLTAVVTAMTALLVGLNAGAASAASVPTTSHRTDTAVSSLYNGAATVKPDFTGFCLTIWSTSNTYAITNCQTAVGFYNQFIHCAGITRPVLGPVMFAPSVYIGSCPAGHDVIDAGADQL